MWRKRENAGSSLQPRQVGGRVFVNSPDRATLGEEILRSINSARRSILIINPLITDERLIQQILAARERGVRVKIITELRENRGTGIRYPTLGFEVDAGVDLKEHFMAIRRVTTNRVVCRGLRYYTHSKVLIVDNEQLILSSANGTSNSLGWGSQPSIEAGVSIHEPSVVSKIAAVIGQVWEQCPFRFHLLENDISLQESAVDTQVDFPLDVAIDHDSHVVWSNPPHGMALRNSLVRLIHQANESITCAALSFYDTNKIDTLHNALLGALERGVRVTVLVRPEHFRADQYPDLSTKTLLEKGMLLLGVSALHAKGIVVDNAACAIFSGNINPFSLESQAVSAQVEIGLCEFGQPHILDSYGKWLTSLEVAADFEYA